MMESYLQNNFGDVKSKNSSEEALQRWRKLCEVVKNRKRRFRFTANLTKRSEAEAMRKTNQLRVAVLVSKAVLQFIQGCTSSSEYTVPEEVEAAGFQICADELGSIVEGHDVKKLKVHGGVEGVANKLATSTTNGITTTDDELRSAGITVRMVTGDNINTAKAIARECGILTDGGLAIEDPEFREKSVDEMIEPITKIQVMARSSPLDKHTLVKHLRTMSNEVVAVTGDGTNDAPALHEADIGIAMGIAGTEVAKESADIIRDDNFSTMVAAAKWGRSVYQKFVQFQLALIVVELIVNFSSACLTGNVLLTAVQLLWVIMIKVALGALALETEPPLDDLMKREPVRRSGGFISNVMWRNILGQSLHQIVVIWYLQTRGKRSFQLAGPDADLILNTLIFNIFFFCQVFNEISSREMEKINVFKGMLKNYVFVGALTCAVAFQVIIIEFLGDFTNTTPLTSAQWFLSIFIGFLEIPIAAIIKLIALVSERDCMQAWKAFKHYLPLYLPLLISPSLSLSFHFSLPLPLPFTPSLKLGLSRSPSLLLSLGSSSLSFSFSTKQRATSSSSSASPSSSSPASLQCCPSSSQEPFVPLQHPHHLCNCKTESHAALPDDCTNSSRGMCISRVERIPSNEAETCPLE